MSIIHGDITKIHEVLKRGYSEPIVQATKGYSLNTGAIAPGVNNFDVTGVTAGYVGFFKIISVSCDDATSIHQITARKIPAVGDVWDFFSAYFSIGYEWNIGDLLISDADTLRIIIDNNAAGNVTFSINIYWIESPAS